MVMKEQEDVNILYYFISALSLKLISKLRENQAGTRLLKELTMIDPIRYATNDVIERWLYDLLLLDASEAVKL